MLANSRTLTDNPDLQCMPAVPETATGVHEYCNSAINAIYALFIDLQIASHRFQSTGTRRGLGNVPRPYVGSCRTYFPDHLLT